MPTEKKVKRVDQVRQWLEGCTIAISTDYTGLPANGMMELRRALRERGVEFHVVKNSLTYLAADAAGMPWLKDIVQGSTGLAFGYGDPTEPARALSDFIRSTRSALTIRGAVLGERHLSADEVESLAALPPKEVLIARLAGQLNAPISRLAHVLGSPAAGLATVLQRQIEAMGA